LSVIILGVLWAIHVWGTVLSFVSYPRCTLGYPSMVYCSIICQLS